MPHKSVIIKYPPPDYTSHAIKAGPFLYTSGIIGIDYNTGTLAGITVEDEIRQALLNIQEILRAEGMTFDHVIKVSVKLTDLAGLSALNKVYSGLFKKGVFPVREVMQVQQLTKNAKVELMMVAYNG